MVIVALDDEKLALNALMEAIQGAMPQAEVQGFRNVQLCFWTLKCVN